LIAAIPFKTADETSWRLRLGNEASSAFVGDALLPMAPHACLLLAEPAVVLLAAMRASGELAPDVVVLAPYDIQGRAAVRAVLRDPALAPIARDIVLTGAPHEYALSSLAAARPLFVVWDPKWERAIARHLVPEGIFDRFSAEPRGPSDRKRPLEAFVAVRDRLSQGTRGDDEIRKTIASLLRARVLSAASVGDRASAARGVEDLRRFSPGDATGGEVVKRIVLAKGPVDVEDLPP